MAAHTVPDGDAELNVKTAARCGRRTDSQANGLSRRAGADQSRCSAFFTELLIKFLAGRGAHGLGLAQHFLGAHHGTRTVLATHETGHGGAAEGSGRHKGRARDFGLVAQTVWENGGLGFSSCHWRCL